MKLHVMFVGSQFIYNMALREYVLRSVQRCCDVVDMVTLHKDGDSSLFLDIEQQVNMPKNLIVVTSKQNASTVGKLVATATGDMQVLQNGALMPQKTVVAEEGSYLLEHAKAFINVVQIDDGQKIPTILLNNSSSKATLHVMDEQKETLHNLLTPIAQTYEVVFELTTLVEGWQRVDLFSKRYGDISNFIAAVKKLLPKNTIASADVVEYMIEKLASQGKKITFAESCTGGLLSYFLTKHNGASKILEGALITYSNELKDNWLAVSEETLKKYGAVSAEVVCEMSEGALDVSHADFAIAVSGIAGDSGGSDEKPVGTVYIGVRSKTEHLEKHLYFQGDRNFIQSQSVLYGLKMLFLLDRETFF
ncbi:MAG: CinA family protein [Epsilonproteobacteria bacterium]|nr:CinA family protein [Campylobacterota bacterium]